MSEFQYKAGLNNVGSYQVSGIPYVTASLAVPANTGTALEIIFPSVTQCIKIHNNSSTTHMRVGFSAKGVSGSNYWQIDPQTSGGLSYVELRVKTDRIFLMSATTSPVTGAYIFAELTGIKPEYNLAEVYSGSAGIG